ncbi:MAG: DNA/RNA nuclease SfsA [Cellvibrionaceae bacterium]
MKITPPLQKATFLRRYKRFLADVVLEDGREITVHCPNTGSMKNCLVSNSPCWISDSNNPKRKYRYSWEIATTPGRKKAGINTSRSNALVVEAIETGVASELQGYSTLKTEVPYGREKSRIDIVLSESIANKKQKCYVEVKNVTLGEKNGLGLFPDSVSTRGLKHLRELISCVKNGDRAVLFYCVQHTGIQRVTCADNIDPAYSNMLREAVSEGVEVLAYKAKLSAKEIKLVERIPFSC